VLFRSEAGYISIRIVQEFHNEALIDMFMISVNQCVCAVKGSCSSHQI